MRRPDPRAAALVLLLALTATGCSGSGSGCTSPDKALVASVMAKAKKGFQVRDTVIDHLELEQASQVALPERLREAGGVALLGLRVSEYDAAPASASFPGVEVVDMFLLDRSSKVVGPVGIFSTRSFDYPTPDVPDWAGISSRLESSSAGDELTGCAGG